MKKLTFEEVKAKFTKYGYELISKEYLGNKHKLDSVDNEGYKYSFLHTSLGKKEPRTFDKGNPYTLENIKLYLKKNNIPLILLSELYVSACKDKMIWQCNKGHVIDMTWNAVQSGSVCRVCAVLNNKRTKPMSLNEFEVKLKRIHGNKYKVFSGYTKIGAKVKVKCEECGVVWEPFAYSLLQGSGCLKCGIKKRSERRTKTHEEYLSQVKAIHGDEYKVLSKYTHGDNKILIQHTGCGSKYYVNANSVLQGKGCSKCAIKKSANQRRKGFENFKEELRELVGNEYSVISKDFKNRKDKIKICHNVCGYVYNVAPQKFLSGRRCPFCRESAGEAQVRTYLEKEGYYFIPQYTFHDLIAEKRLRFDFVVFEKEKILFAIEYDGQQHFKPIPFWGGEKGFETQKKRDELKNSYCAKKGIHLIRIPYYTKNIHQELNNQISKLNIHL